MGNTSNLNKMSCLLRKKSGYILFNSVITLSISPVRSSAQIPITILAKNQTNSAKYTLSVFNIN